MSDDPWRIFPYPTIARGAVTDGSVRRAERACRECPLRQCSASTAPIGELRQCKWGYVYSRVDDERVVAGVIASIPDPNPRLKKNLRLRSRERVVANDITSAIDSVQSLGIGFVESFEQSRRHAFEHIGDDPALLAAVLANLRSEFDDNLAQSHDFLQLLNQIRGHAETLLRLLEPELDVHHAAEKHSAEGAIYFAAELMRLKVDALVYVQDPNRANEDARPFEIHPLVLKYARIYEWQALQKNLDLRLEGSCYARVTFNNDAIGAVIQGLLDNLIKYAPAGSRATIRFDERHDHVRIDFISLGPLVKPDERAKLWIPRFRGAAARAIEPLGQGIGLATVRSVADAIAINVEFDQASCSDDRFAARYQTTFTLKLPKD